MKQYEYLLLLPIFEKIDYTNFNIFEPYGFLDLSYDVITLLTLTIEDDDEFGYYYKLWINPFNSLCIMNI